jgi:hypothetical protein
MSLRAREKLENQSHTGKTFHHNIQQLATRDGISSSGENMNLGKRAFLRLQNSQQYPILT